MNRLFSAAAALTLASAAIAAAPAAAEPIWRVGEGYVVRHHDLDLSTAQGRQVLLARVERAAEIACGRRFLRVEQQACREETTRIALSRAGGAERRALQIAVMERSSSAYARR